MPLRLTIENMDRLPDGGPVRIQVEGRGLDIGRDQHLDWTLPDPSRHISSKHCEIRFRDDGYWVHDVSTNGTFMNGAETRLKGPHRLRNGDRFVIGQYIIAAALEEELSATDEAPPANAPSSDEDLWDAVPAAAPVDARQLKGRQDLAPARSDFLDWAADVPVPIASPVTSPAASVSAARREAVGLDLEADGWAAGPPPPPAPKPDVSPQPMPRRPDADEARRARPVSTSDPMDISPRAADAGADGAAMATFARLLARGAGLPEDSFAGRDPGELAEQFGRLLKLATENMRQLLEGRQQAKRLARSSNHTTVQAINNNPLKFAPTTDDALRIMFAARGQSYLDAERAFAQGFDDLKRHQIKTYTAMRRAVALLVADMDPAAIDAACQSDRGLAGMMGSRKARLWDIFVARWQIQVGRHDHGILEAFMDHFARCYEGE